MISIFRKIRQKLLKQNQVTRYLVYAIGEILLVVIGILIALQVNNWNELRKARSQELATMKEVIENLKYDILRSEKNSVKNFDLLIGLDSLRISITNTIEGKDETVKIYYFALKYGQDYSQVSLNRTAYDQLINSGTIQLIANRQLVQDLSDYYERKSYAVLSYDPEIGLRDMKNIQKKFIQLRGLDDYIQSFDSISDNTYTPDYDYKDLLQREDLQLLKPDQLKLDDYLNEISQFQLDLKNYNFYTSWAKESAEKLLQDIEKEYKIISKGNS